MLRSIRLMIGMAELYDTNGDKVDSHYIKGIVVDLAGPLLHDGFNEVIEHYEDIYKIPEGKLKKYKNMYWTSFSLGKMTKEEYWGTIFAECDVKLTDTEIEKIDAELVDAFTPFPDVIDTLKSLRPGYKICLLTNVSKEWFDCWDEKYGLRDSVDYVMASYDTGVRKPDKRAVYNCVEKMQLEEREIVFFDDQYANFRELDESGIRCVHVTEESNPLLTLVEA